MNARPMLAAVIVAFLLHPMLLAGPGIGSAPLLSERTASPGGIQDQVVAFEWWNHPGLIQNALAAVGVAPALGNMAMARSAAEGDGRARLAKTMYTMVQKLAEDWVKDVGDLRFQQRFFFPNECFSRPFIDISGSRAFAYNMDRKTDPPTMYVLMVLEPERALEWLHAVGHALTDQAFRDETIFSTEAMKDHARDRLEALIEREAERVRDGHRSLQRRLAESLERPKQPIMPSGRSEPARQWWSDPAVIREHWAAVGVATDTGNPIRAFRSAKAAGKSKLVAMLKIKIQYFALDWVKELRDLGHLSGSFIRLLSDNEVLLDLCVEKAIVGGYAVKYQRQGDQIHCLVILDPEEIGSFLAVAGLTFLRQALDQELFAVGKDEAALEKAKRSLERLIDKQTARAVESTQDLIREMVDAD